MQSSFDFKIKFENFIHGQKYVIKKQVSTMLNEKMLSELDAIASTLINVEEIEDFSFMRCDCTGGCTDDCYACAHDSGSQY